jgi:hypothetical protein
MFIIFKRARQVPLTKWLEITADVGPALEVSNEVNVVELVTTLNMKSIISFFILSSVSTFAMVRFIPISNLIIVVNWESV